MHFVSTLNEGIFHYRFYRLSLIILNLSLFLDILPLFIIGFPKPHYLPLPILSDRNAAEAIIKAGLTAASESRGQKGNKIRLIGGQLPGAKVRYDQMIPRLQGNTSTK